MQEIDQIPNPKVEPLQSNQILQPQISQIRPINVIQEIQIPTITSQSEERRISTPPIVRGLEVPVVDVPNPRIDYPIIDVPTEEEFKKAVASEKNQEEGNKEEKTRELPPSSLPQNLNQIVQQVQPIVPVEQNQQTISVPPKSELESNTINVMGTTITLPEASVVATAGAVAVVTTAATVASTAVFNALKNATEPFIKEAVKNKFKVKIKVSKPVLHYVMASDGHVDVFEYSATGTRLVAKIQNVEQYIRDQVDTNSLYELENKIIIDEPLKEKFTKEGQQRFKGYFAAPARIARNLAARFVI